MHRVYVTLFLDFYFIFEMVAVVSTNTPSTDVFPLGKVWKSSAQSLMLPVLLSSSADQRDGSWLSKQNLHRATSRSISDDIPERASPSRRELAQAALTIDDESLGRHSGLHDVILQKGNPGNMYQVYVKRKHIRDEDSVQIKRNILTGRDYDRLSPAAKDELWRRTRSVPEAGFTKSSFRDDHGRLVKRDSSLITEYCGPLGNRCQYVGEGECVNICINGRRRTLCKVRNSWRNLVCVVL